MAHYCTNCCDAANGSIRLCPLHAKAPEMLDALSVLTAAMENVLLHLGLLMTAEDKAGRTKLVDSARAILKDLEG